MSEAIIQDYRHELTWFSVDTGQIRLDFGAVAVDIYGDSEIIETDGTIETIDDVWEHRGHLQAIWRILGRSMTGFVMDEDSFRLPFEDSALIRAKNKKSYDFVKVWGPDPRCETGYPTALGTPDPRIMQAMRQMMEGPGPKLFFPFPYTPEFLESFRNSPPELSGILRQNLRSHAQFLSRATTERKSRSIMPENSANSRWIQMLLPWHSPA